MTKKTTNGKSNKKAHVKTKVEMLQEEIEKLTSITSEMEDRMYTLQDVDTCEDGLNNLAEVKKLVKELKSYGIDGGELIFAATGYFDHLHKVHKAVDAKYKQLNKEFKASEKVIEKKQKELDKLEDIERKETGMSSPKPDTFTF